MDDRAGAAKPEGPTDRHELQTFVDRFFARHMRAYHVPGAVFVLVKNGNVLLARGYGYADLERKRPVLPGRTLFRICSVSKVVTATAVMQLAERGAVRLNDDVNRYLALFKLPASYPQPVTLAELLTHTAGFEDRHIGRSTLERSGLQPLGPYLSRQMPGRVMPPGQTYSYSDYGYALAGYVVEAVTGVPFARYVEQHIFGPLGMRHSSFNQPLPAPLARDLAIGYDVQGNAQPHPAPFEYFNTAPAAGMSATALDMARLMIAHLQDGKYGAVRILRAGTVQAMHRQHFSSYPRLPGLGPMPGIADGFGLYYRNGQQILEHSGALRGYTSLLTLLPGQKLGFFIAGNTAHDAYMFDLSQRLLDHYFPRPKRVVRPVGRDGALSPVDRYAGSYWSNEYSRHTIEKLRQLVNQVQVRKTGSSLLSARFWNGRTVRLREVAPDVFQTASPDPTTYWVFHRKRDGTVTEMVPGGNEVFDRISWYETTAVQLGFIGLVATLFLSGCAVWLLIPLLRWMFRRARKGGRRRMAGGGRGRVTGLLLGASSTMNVFFLVTLALLMWGAVSTQDQHYSWIEYGVPPGVIALLCIPLLTTCLAFVFPLFAVLAWRRSYWSLGGRIHYSAVALGSLAFVPFLLYWNLLGFNY